MEKIISPLQFLDKGPEVNNLHQAILAIWNKIQSAGIKDIFAESDFRETFDREMADRTYGQATQQLVSAFQQSFMHTVPTGNIDDPTANAINTLLVKYKLVDTPPTPPAVYSVSGTVYDQWIEPMADTPVMIFDKDMRSEHLLAEGKTDAKGAYSITYSKNQLSQQDKGGANLIVRVYGSDGD